MKKLIIPLILLTGCTIGHAQINLREGIVITLDGDTLQGQIDYRTDNMNAQQCVFMANGASATTTYLPGQIEGYRFLDNGRYYVSRSVMLPDSTRRTAFLEFLVRGQMSVYYLGNTTPTLFYFEQEDGTQTIVKYIARNADAKVRREALAEIYTTLMGSSKAQSLLWTKELDAGNVTYIAASYNDEVCPDGQCEIFKYRNPKGYKESLIWHFTAKAGITCYKFNSHRYYRYVNRLDPIYGGVIYDKDDIFQAPSFAVGVDCYFPRLCRGLLAQLYVEETLANHTSYHTKSSYHFELGNYKPIVDVKTGAVRYKSRTLSFKFGPAYQFPLDKVQPRVAMGLSFSNYIFSLDFTDQNAKMKKRGVTDPGRYFNVGLIFPLKNGAVVADGEYHIHHHYETNEDWENITMWTFSLGYQF